MKVTHRENGLKSPEEEIQMNRDVIISCAITGGGDSHLRHKGVPSTPQQIADSAIAAAKAGAAIVHLHVREEDGTPCRKVELYEKTCQLIRESDVDVIINLTTGVGGDYIPDAEDPMKLGEGSDLLTPAERIEHVRRCKPEICTLDCGTFNDGDNIAYIATLDTLRETAKQLLELGVLPEIEAFELGHINQAKILLREGLLPENTIFQLCMGVAYCAEATTSNVVAMHNTLPNEVKNWGCFGVGRDQMSMMAQSVIMGGNARVGLEDNIYLDKGVFATNEQLVVRGREIIERMGGHVLTVAQARVKLGLK